MLIKMRGYTLIEVMIVVAIVAILATIGYQSYRQHILKSRRGEARDALTRYATLQERWFFQNSSYTKTIANLGGAATPDGNYTISVAPITASACASDDTCKDYTLTAVTVSTSPQYEDTKCRTFTLNSRMQRGAKDASDADSTADCWP